MPEPMKLSDLPPELWQRVSDLFDEVIDLPETDRIPYIRNLWGSEPLVAKELMALLVAAANGDKTVPLTQAPFNSVLKEALTEPAEGYGYTVDTAIDGRMGLIAARGHTPDLVILDWMLPGMDGLEVCHRLRTGGSIPILMLTGKDTVQDRIQGLYAGADDYMVKPFILDELVARVRALLRRTQPERIPVLKFADLSLDTGSRQAARGARMVALTAKEYELLELFLRHPTQVLTREVMFDRVWGYDLGGESNVLEVYIRYLRQKLEGEGEMRLIHTVRGVGYVMRENP